MPASFASTDPESENTRRGNPQRFSSAENRSSATEKSLETQLGVRGRVINDAAVEKFGKILRAQIMAKNSGLRRGYVRMLVGTVSVNDNEIVIAGSKAALEAAISSGETGTAAAVPSFDQKWCPTGDKDGHSDHWKISVPRV